MDSTYLNVQPIALGTGRKCGELSIVFSRYRTQFNGVAQSVFTSADPLRLNRENPLCFCRHNVTNGVGEWPRGNPSGRTTHAKIGVDQSVAIFCRPRPIFRVNLSNWQFRTCNSLIEARLLPGTAAPRISTIGELHGFSCGKSHLNWGNWRMMIPRRYRHENEKRLTECTQVCLYYSVYGRVSAVGKELHKAGGSEHGLIIRSARTFRQRAPPPNQTDSVSWLISIMRFATPTSPEDQHGTRQIP